MKKLILTASIVALSSGTAFAQVVPTAPTVNNPGVQLSEIAQTGVDNEATVDQTGGQEGISDISQDGNNHLAEVTQSEAPTVGSNSFGTPANIADIDQIGDNTRARVEQVNDNPGGSSNTAVIDQNGYDGVFTSTLPSGFALNGRIIQNGSGNQSSILQSAPAATDGDSSGLSARNEQTGTGNLSLIVQDGDLDADPITTASVTQTGDFNQSDVFQQGNNQIANVDQIGDSNFSMVDQTGDSNEADVNQNGDTGTSTVIQTGDDQYAELNQSASGNTSNITQGNGLGFGDNSAIVTQSTVGNLSNVVQNGTNNMATVNQ